VKARFVELGGSRLHSFPPARGRLAAPTERGVYIIYGLNLKLLHVGGTPRARRGIFQRLSDHLHGQSSFTDTSKYLKRHGGLTLKERYTYVRDFCKYRYLIVKDDRMRALLEAYAIGQSVLIILVLVRLRLNQTSPLPPTTIRNIKFVRPEARSTLLGPGGTRRGDHGRFFAPRAA
jgi:hypothetical protein